MRLFRDLRRLVIADVRVERGHQHQRFTHQLRDALEIGFDAQRAVVVEARGAVGEQTHALQEIVDDHRLEHVEFEISHRAANVDRHVVAEYLAAEHGQRLGLGRVDLARHDGTARFILRNAQLADAAARAGRKQADVVGDFHERGRKRFQRTVRVNQGIVCGQRFELVTRRYKRVARLLRQFPGDPLPELGMRIQTGADGGAAQRQFGQMRKRGLNVRDAVLELGYVAREFLAQGQGRRVLQVGAADLDDVIEGFRLGHERISQLLDRGNQFVMQCRDGRDVHRGREHVVRGLALVDIVVGMHEALVAALAAEQL